MAPGILQLLSGDGGSVILPGEADRLADEQGCFDLMPVLRGIVTTLPEDVFLWLEGEKRKLARFLPPHSQQEKDCTAHAWAVAAQDYVLCRDTEDWLGELSTEVLYGGSRHTIGKGRLAQPGSCCAWVAAFLVKYGVLVRGQYANYDLSSYSFTLTQQFGQTGLPSELTNRLHLIQRAENTPAQVSRVRSADMAQTALTKLCPVPFSSRRGFETVRGSEGICQPKGEWNHCMVMRGVCRTASGKLCFAVQNSVGDYLGEQNQIVPLSNGRTILLPPGVFLVDAEVINEICDKEDAYTIF